MKNPALAAQIPLIGHIFSELEGKISSPGDYSKNSIKLPVEEDKQGNDAEGSRMADGVLAADDTADHTKENDTEKDYVKDHAKEDYTDGERFIEAGTDQAYMAENNEEESDRKGDISYRKKSGGLTITLSEVAYDHNALYLAMLAQSRDAFATDLLEKNLLTFTCLVRMYKADGTVEEFNYDEGAYLGHRAEGEYTDSRTFKGIAQFGGLDCDFSEYTSCELVFTEFQQMLKTGKTRKENIPVTNEEVTVIDHDIVRYKGNWTFRLDIDVTEDTKQETAVNDTNDQGYGIEKVVKTAYEMYAVPILPEGEKDYDYMITIWDADGKPLDLHGTGFNRSIYGRDVSEVTVYLLRWEDFCESKGSNTYLQPSKAIYQTKVRFDE